MTGELEGATGSVGGTAGEGSDEVGSSAGARPEPEEVPEVEAGGAEAVAEGAGSTGVSITGGSTGTGNHQRGLLVTYRLVPVP
ncbi:hypothetical protein GCM10020219_037790 [Nonomuraea dietziae]